MDLSRLGGMDGRRELGVAEAEPDLDAGGRGVAVVPVTHGLFDRSNKVRRSMKSKRDGIADVQVAHLATCGLDLFGFGHDVANGVGKSPHAGRHAN